MTTLTPAQAIANTRALLQQATDDLRAQAALVDQGKAAPTTIAPKITAAAVAKANLDDAYSARVEQVTTHKSGEYVQPEWYAHTAELAGTATGTFSVQRSIDDGLGKSITDAGFDLKSKPSVEISAYAGLKANVFPAATSLAPRVPGAVVAMGRDSRWLWPHMNPQDAGDDLSIEDFKQTARTLTGTVERAVDAVTDKAHLDVTVTFVNEAMRQLAVTIDDIPNAILQSVPLLAAFLATEGQFQVEQSLDAHVMAQIVASTPPFGTTGANLVEKVRNGVATMRATGASPSLLVINPTDAAALDLQADAGGYIFPLSTTGSSSPLWGLRVIERIGAGTEPPYLIDPQMLGVLYLGTMRFDADPYTGFRQNLTTLRVETHALMHIRNANGARRIAAT